MSTPDVDLLVTLWPSFPHFPKFAADNRISGVRLNSAMMSSPELSKELERIKNTHVTNPLFYDIKGRQPRVVEVIPNRDNLTIRLNHPVKVAPNVPIIFKGGMDEGRLDHLEEDGSVLVFQGGPRFQVKVGESLCIRAPHKILGDQFTPAEKEKISMVRAGGFTRYFLSYVESQADVDEFRELVGPDAEVWLKIENERGLRYVSNEFVKTDNTTLVAARGDLYVELSKPHLIAKALKLIVNQDPFACAASRILLSVVDKTADTETLWKYTDEENNVFYLPNPAKYVNSPRTGQSIQTPPVKTYLNAMKTVVNPVPSCADFLELQWLYDVGYRKFMLCDELCLRDDLLRTAVNAFDSFRSTL